MHGFSLAKNQIEDLGMICGGNVTIYIQILKPENADIISFLEEVCELFRKNENSWLLYELCGRKDGQVTQWMQALKNGGVYTVDDNTHRALTESFDAGWADDEKAAETIRTVRDAHGYTMDPHTAVAWTVAEEYAKRTGDNRPMVVVSTASPYKFSRSVLTAIAGEGAAEGLDEFTCADKLETLSGMRMPASLRELRGKAQRHKDVVAPADMIDEVRAWTK